MSLVHLQWPYSAVWYFNSLRMKLHSFCSTYEWVQGHGFSSEKLEKTCFVGGEFLSKLCLVMKTLCNKLSNLITYLVAIWSFWERVQQQYSTHKFQEDKKVNDVDNDQM